MLKPQHLSLLWKLTSNSLERNFIFYGKEILPSSSARPKVQLDMKPPTVNSHKFFSRHIFSFSTKILKWFDHHDEHTIVLSYSLTRLMFLKKEYAVWCHSNKIIGIDPSSLKTLPLFVFTKVSKKRSSCCSFSQPFGCLIMITLLFNFNRLFLFSFTFFPSPVIFVHIATLHRRRVITWAMRFNFCASSIMKLLKCAIGK